MNPGPEADRVLLAHMRDCLDRIREYTNADRDRFDESRLVQDAVVRNLQTLAESNLPTLTEAVNRMATHLGPDTCFERPQAVRANLKNRLPRFADAG